MASPKPITFNLASSLTELDRLNSELERIGDAWEIPPTVILQLNLALDELFTNVVDYGLASESSKRIAITLQLHENKLEVTMCDEGTAFDPTEPADPDLDVPLAEKEIGGLGIFLVRQYTDSIEYHRENGKNIVTLTKNLKESL